MPIRQYWLPTSHKLSELYNTCGTGQYTLPDLIGTSWRIYLSKFGQLYSQGNGVRVEVKCIIMGVIMKYILWFKIGADIGKITYIESISIEAQ
jgi:hypothetical protein